MGSSFPERIFRAARVEFSFRGYHGARIKGISRRAGCNVALLYRHWPSKKRLYLDVLRAAWTEVSRDVDSRMGRGVPGARDAIAAYLDALMRNEEAAQILVREYIDGARFLPGLLAAQPELTAPLARAVKAFDVGPRNDEPLRPGLDAALAGLAIASMAASMSAGRRGAQALLAWLDRPLTPQGRWQDQLYDLLVYGAVGEAPGT